jgi:hypothetical protein
MTTFLQKRNIKNIKLYYLLDVLSKYKRSTGGSFKDEVTNSAVKFLPWHYGMVDYVSTTIGRN